MHEQQSLIGDFALFKLIPYLTELGCSEPGQSRLVAWYWHRSKQWHASDQSEFDAIAREHLKVEWTTRSIRAGASKSIPSRFRSEKFLGYSSTGQEKTSSTGLVEDATQDGWLRLLEDATRDASRDGAQANSAGRSAGRDLIRGQKRFVQLSEDGEDPESGESTEATAPWDEIDASDLYRADSFSADVHRVLKSLKKARRVEIMQKLADESPADFEFLMNYLNRKGRGRFTRKENEQARSIVERLRRAADGGWEFSFETK